MNKLFPLSADLAILFIFLAFILGILVGVFLCAWATNLNYKRDIKQRKQQWDIYTKDGFSRRIVDS